MMKTFPFSISTLFAVRALRVYYECFMTNLFSVFDVDVDRYNVLGLSWGWMVGIFVACLILWSTLSFGTSASTRPCLLSLCSHDKYSNVQVSVRRIIQGYCALTSPSEFDTEEVYLLSFRLSFIITSTHGRIYMIMIIKYCNAILNGFFILFEDLLFLSVKFRRGSQKQYHVLIKKY